MTISKFLMNVAVCAISASAASTVYGSEISPLHNDDQQTPQRGTIQRGSSIGSGGSIENVDSMLDDILAILTGVPQSIVVCPQNEFDALKNQGKATKKRVTLLGVTSVVKATVGLSETIQTQAAELDTLKTSLETVKAEKADLLRQNMVAKSETKLWKRITTATGLVVVAILVQSAYRKYVK